MSYCPHFRDEETEAQKLGIFQGRHLWEVTKSISKPGLTQFQRHLSGTGVTYQSPLASLSFSRSLPFPSRETEEENEKHL